MLSRCIWDLKGNIITSVRKEKGIELVCKGIISHDEIFSQKVKTSVWISNNVLKNSPVSFKLLTTIHAKGRLVFNKLESYFLVERIIS